MQTRRFRVVLQVFTGTNSSFAIRHCNHCNICLSHIVIVVVGECLDWRATFATSSIDSSTIEFATCFFFVLSKFSLQQLLIGIDAL
jgi:hypothetical protein